MRLPTTLAEGYVDFLPDRWQASRKESAPTTAELSTDCHLPRPQRRDQLAPRGGHAGFGLYAVRRTLIGGRDNSRDVPSLLPYPIHYTLQEFQLVT